ncbi:MAG: MFS transporter [Eubacteriales bacterium]|nr:MFS transporter [Eubacteriales bacterium]
MKTGKRFSKTEWSWILYDWANSIWATNISAAIFPIYFALKATDTGNAVFGYMVSIANLLVALLAPYLGAIGDFRGMKKRLWLGFMLLGVVFTAFMGVFGSWQMMLVGFVLSRIGFSGSCLFYDSFLTDVTTPDRMDKVSTWGYAMGYIGGSTIPFVISIAVMLAMGMSDLSYRIAILIVPVWWLAFSIPFWKNVEQVHCVNTPPSRLGREALRNTLSTFRGILRNKALLFFILAYFFYIDGVGTIINMATNYGSTLGLGSIGMILALLVTQVVAMPFSILFGNWSKKFGALRLIGVAVGVYAFITVVGFVMGFLVDFHETLGVPYETAISVSTVLFWVLATLVGTVQGGIQALSRSYYGQLVPPERSNEYYGFLDIFGKFASVIGPALYALVYGLTGKPSFGILSLILLFVCGGGFLLAGRPYFEAAARERSAK